MLTQADKLVRAKQLSSDISNSLQASAALPPILMRANLSDTEAVHYKRFYPEFQIGVEYKKDWIISYQDRLYRIGQDRTSQEQWHPGDEGTTALYSWIAFTEDGYEIWREWDGVSGDYDQDQIVWDSEVEQLYKSKIATNVYGPPHEQPTYWDIYTPDTDEMG